MALELRHAAVTVDHRLQHAQHGIRTEAIPLGQVVNRLFAGWGELTHLTR
jgi:hypothetical protein